eukprot:gene3537-6272_t
MKTYKVAIVGADSVGKSSCTFQFLHSTFHHNYDPTIENIFQSIFQIENQNVSLELLDTSGQEDYTCLNDHYLRSCDGFYFIFDLTNEKSLQQIEKHIERVGNIFEEKEFSCVLIGNKLDLVQERKISKQDMKYLVNEHFKMEYFEVSAKEGTNIDSSFHKLVDILHQKNDSKKKKNYSSKKRKCIIS